MRITIIAIGTRGDVQPLVALGAGLRASGHQVRIATHANFEALARRYGLDFLEITGNPREILQGESGKMLLTTERNLLRYVGRLMSVVEPLLLQLSDDLWAACQDTQVVIYSLLGLAAHTIASELGIPSYAACLQPLSPSRAFPSLFAPAGLHLGQAYNYVTHLLTEQIYWHAVRPAASRSMRRHNLRPPPFWGPFRELATVRQPLLYGYSPSVFPKPRDWSEAAQVTGYWFLDRPVDWQPPEELVDFLRAGPPPVCVGFGSMSTLNPEATTDQILRALKRAGKRGVLITGWGGISNTDLPDDAIKVEDVPHDWIFPQAAAVVHHGGAGTTAACLRAGVPSIAVPFFFDQFFWGHRVAELGAGPSPIPRKNLNVESLAAAIKVATELTGLRSRAAALSECIRAEDGVRQAVNALHRSLNGRLVMPGPVADSGEYGS